MTLPARIRNGYWGMGDNVMQLPVVRELCRRFPQVYLATPWPQLYWELPNIRLTHPLLESRSFVYEWTHFRENIEAQPASTWSELPPDWTEFWWGSGGHAKDSTRLAAICPAVELPARVSTRFGLKREWLRAAREWLDLNMPGNRPRVLMHVPVAPPGRELARDAIFEAFAVVFKGFSRRVAFFDAARTEPGICEPIGRLPMPTFRSFGPDITTLWALSSLADAIVTSPCHFGDLAIAFSRPTLLLCGGCMGPQHVYDPRQDMSKMAIAAPDPFCECGHSEHQCNKDLDLGMVVEKFQCVLNTL